MKLKKFISITVLIGLTLLSGCAGDKQNQIDIANKIVEDYMTALIDGDPDEISKQISSAMNSLSDREKRELDLAKKGHQRDISPNLAENIRNAFKGVDPAEEFYSTELDPRDSAILPLASASLAVSLREKALSSESVIKVEVPDRNYMFGPYEEMKIRMKKDSSFKPLRLKVTSEGELITQKVAKTMPNKVHLLHLSDSQWAVDAEDIIAFYTEEKPCNTQP